MHARLRERPAHHTGMRLALLVAGVGLLLAACAGSGGSSADPTPPSPIESSPPTPSNPSESPPAGEPGSSSAPSGPDDSVAEGEPDGSPAPEPVPPPDLPGEPQVAGRPASVDVSGLSLPPDPSQAPRVDPSVAIVPLGDVVFDTFDGNFVRLPEAGEGLARQLRDAIRPVYQPIYGGPDALPWLMDDDLVLTYEAGGETYAYPLKILNLRELVNDVIDGDAVLISYCPLCGSGVVFSRSLDGQVLLFGNTSALFETDLVAFDWQTGSYWYQVAGRAIVGELSGSSLDVLPSSVARWGDVRELYPNAMLLVGDGEESFASELYGRDTFAGYTDLIDEGRFPFPVNEDGLDDRLRAGAPVLVVEAGESARAYPIGAAGDVVNDEVGGVPVVLFALPGSATAVAYGRTVGGRVLTFEASDGSSADVETGTTWDAAGRAIEGELGGERLEPLPTRRALWFSIGLSFPGIDLYMPEPGG